MLVFINDSAALTLMSTDVDRIAFSLQQISEVWARMVELAIGIWLLERQVGWICIGPIIAVIGMLSLSVICYWHCLIDLSRFILWLSASCETARPSAKKVGERSAATSGSYLFHASVNEECQVDGYC